MPNLQIAPGESEPVVVCYYERHTGSCSGPRRLRNGGVRYRRVRVRQQLSFAIRTV
jgi:hypothetical protein